MRPALTQLLAIGKPGTTELLVLLLIVLVLFGPTQLPKLTKMFGKSIKNFKDGMTEKDETDSDHTDKEA